MQHIAFTVEIGMAFLAFAILLLALSVLWMLLEDNSDEPSGVINLDEDICEAQRDMGWPEVMIKQDAQDNGRDYYPPKD